MKKKYLLFILCLFAFFCINIDGVKAKENTCRYSGKMEDTNTRTGQHYYSTVWLEIVYNDNSGTSYEVYVAVDDSDSGYEKITFNDYDDGNRNDVSDKIYLDACPASVYVKYVPQTDNGALSKKIAGYYFSYSKGASYKKMEPTNEDLDTVMENAIVHRDNEQSNTDFIPNILNWAKKGYEYTYDNDSTTSSDVCVGLLGQSALVLKNLNSILSVIGIVLLIILSIVDFIKAVASSEDDALSNAFKDTKKRIVATIILLLLPIILNWLIAIINSNIIWYNGESGEGKLVIQNVSDCINEAAAAAEANSGSKLEPNGYNETGYSNDDHIVEDTTIIENNYSDGSIRKNGGF